MPGQRPADGLPASLSAVLPAYNEEAVIASTLRRTHAVIAGLGMDAFEVIVVDDGSRDRTRSVCLDVGAELDSVRVISHRANRGYGAALRTGFEAATGDAIFLMDSDGQFDPADLRLLLARWGAAAVVCGCRTERRDPWIRRLNNRAFFRLVDALVGATARDVNCGFKLFPTAIGQGLAAEGALISTELLVRAREQGLRIVDVAVPHHPRTTGRPTGARPAVVLRAFGELRRLRRDLRHRPPRAQATEAPAPTAVFPSSRS